MGAELLLLLAMAAVPSLRAPPPTPLEVTVGGTIVTGTVSGRVPDRYRFVPSATGTVVVSLDLIQGPTPKARLKNAQGKTLRRTDRRGKIWARPAAGTPLVLEVMPGDARVGSTYQLTIAFDADRPRALRDQRRPARPREVVRIRPANALDLEHVVVDGIPTEHTINAGDVLVTIPAFARAGPIELHFESRPPQLVAIDLIGVEPPRADLVTQGCVDNGGGVVAGCLRLVLSPSVGSQWLAAIARVLDADVTGHRVQSGAVELKLRLPSSETYALELLKTMPGVVEAASGTAAGSSASAR